MAVAVMVALEEEAVESAVWRLLWASVPVCNSDSANVRQQPVRMIMAWSSSKRDTSSERLHRQ